MCVTAMSAARRLEFARLEKLALFLDVSLLEKLRIAESSGAIVRNALSATPPRLRTLQAPIAPSLAYQINPAGLHATYWRACLDASKFLLRLGISLRLRLFS